MTKTGIAYITVGLGKRMDERDERLYGLPPAHQHEPYVRVCWNIKDDRDAPVQGEAEFEDASFDNVEDAIEWARERAPMVLVRLWEDDTGVWSAGERRATHELPEYGGTDLTPYPEWPPGDWPNTVIPPLGPRETTGQDDLSR
jgi:hypothetical protein